MMDYRKKVIYILVLFFFLVCSISFGYVKIKSNRGISLNNTSVKDYAKRYEFNIDNAELVTASTKTIDIEVVYKDLYHDCNESIKTSKMHYGTTMDKVKELEEKYQAENGLLYEVEAEGQSRIIYVRKLEGNCPNHFEIIFKDNIIKIYSVRGENKKELYMELTDINIENIRKELKEKIEKGINLNSKKELNDFIEDLES